MVGGMCQSHASTAVKTGTAGDGLSVKASTRWLINGDIQESRDSLHPPRFEAKKNFIESSAAYSLVVYFLQAPLIVTSQTTSLLASSKN